MTTNLSSYGSELIELPPATYTYVYLMTTSNSLQAYVVLGQFLVLKKSKDLFIDWLKDDIGANNKQASDCYQCLSDWCDEFL